MGDLSGLVLASRRGDRDAFEEMVRHSAQSNRAL